MNQLDHHRTGPQSIVPEPATDKNRLWNFSWIPAAIRFLYVFLFTYTGFSKLQDIGSFAKGIRKVPFFGDQAELIGWGIPIMELMLAMGMILPFVKVQKWSLRISVVLMAVFTIYLLLMVSLVKDKLCHCGGAIGSLGWTQHLVLNFIILGLGLWAARKKN